MTDGRVESTGRGQASASVPAAEAGASRLTALDGWRAISIISVLACHLLPLGPKSWQLNATAGPFGMVIFFILSGFLITRNLLHKPQARSFFIRRACRILPLAYLFVPVVLMLQSQDLRHCLAYYVFCINYETQYITHITSHLWSLCVEVHFYVFVGILVAISGRRGLLILPFLALFVTGVRVWESVPISIATHLRVDEILAGATVALIHSSARWGGVRRLVGRAASDGPGRCACGVLSPDERFPGLSEALCRGDHGGRHALA